MLRLKIFIEMLKNSEALEIEFNEFFAKVKPIYFEVNEHVQGDRIILVVYYKL